LKDAFRGRISLGVLCGSLILLPKEAFGKLQRRISDNGIADDAISLNQFDKDENYVRIIPREGIRNHIVRLMTDMFNAGDLTVLVGTQALLGEGWDAPSINSLILSSTVSSYMLSNQMRGRAIRIDIDHPEKVSNIWHLATYDPKFGNYSYDLQQLATRFEGYEAPSYYGSHEIVSGIERVLLPNLIGLPETNLALAKNRDITRRWWWDALYTGYGATPPNGLVKGVQADSLNVKALKYTGYGYYVLALLAFVPLLLLLKGPVMAIGLSVIALLLFLIFLSYCRTGTVEGVMKQIAIVILETLSDLGLIKTSIKQVGLKVKNESGNLFVFCANLPAEENNLFIQSLQEFLDPVENPRYLLVRRSRILKWIRQTDYFAIPSAISPNKKGVEIFKGLWKLYIGHCDIVYTRSAEGRKVLLKARKYAFSAVKHKASKRLSKWQ
jgi:Helicase conserved C-terminal domain.